MRPASARIASYPAWAPDAGPAPPSPYPRAAKRVASDSARAEPARPEPKPRCACASAQRGTPRTLTHFKRFVATGGFVARGEDKFRLRSLRASPTDIQPLT
jgi:hypothetical protein